MNTAMPMFDTMPPARMYTPSPEVPTDDGASIGDGPGLATVTKDSVDPAVDARDCALDVERAVVRTQGNRARKWSAPLGVDRIRLRF
jgi:hypothetical protein